MKKNTLDKIAEVLEKEINEVILPEDVMEKARLPLERMVKIV